MDEDVSKDGNSEDIEDNQNDVENKGNTKDKDHDVHKDKNQNKGNKINQKTEGNRNEPNDTQLSDMQGAEDDMPSKQKHDKWRYEEIPVTLYDTPLFDEVLGDKSINSRGFHAIGLLLPLTRLTEERKKFFKQVSEAFDGKLSQYTIIIFTHSENQGGIDEIKKEVNLANDKHLNDLITKSGDRCVLFDPTRNKDEMALEFTEKLMDVVDNTSHEQIHLQKESFGKVMFKRLRLT
ncbi:uncharacterized protein LOC125676349 [Ostrea edulis]|uniref:uncharacterized protein LOC125676349 n=1 Tax=Ostrea edulis TaxID=37623 RepID=UPI0024AE8995|nr:uncharacterized protein LOC125676349 [Ostrea edulis]